MDILIISDDVDGSNIKNHLKNLNYTIHFARGPLTVENKLQSHSIQQVLYIGTGNMQKLYFDICQVLNKFQAKLYLYQADFLSEVELKQLRINFSFIKDITEITNGQEPKNNVHDVENELDYRLMLTSANKQKLIHDIQIVKSNDDTQGVSVKERNQLKKMFEQL